MKPSIVIVSPQDGQSFNRADSTATRWMRMLARDYTVSVVERWFAEHELPSAIIALNARRCADSIARYRRRKPEGAVLLVLSGVDLYRDIHMSNSAQQSLSLADEVIVHQPKALETLPETLRWKARVIYPSARASSAIEKSSRRFNIVQVGTLRHENDPFTPITALRTLMDESNIRLIHIGAARDREHAALIKRVQREEPRLVWAGAKEPANTRRYIKRANLLVVASKIEGGSEAVIEAMRGGVPVIASHVSGNIGILGEDYSGYFTFGDAHACAALMQRCESDRKFLAKLLAQCAKRAKLFSPEREAAALRVAIKSVL